MADKDIIVQDKSGNNCYPTTFAYNVITRGNTTVSDEINTINSKIYPVGSIYMSVNSTSPSSIYGGTWAQLKDTFLLAHGDTYTSTASSTTTQVTAEGGSATKNIQVGNLPPHRHFGFANTIVNTNDGSSVELTSGNFAGAVTNTGGWMNSKMGASGIDATVGNTSATGNGTALDIMPPYLVVYMWKRIS